MRSWGRARRSPWKTPRKTAIFGTTASAPCSRARTTRSGSFCRIRPSSSGTQGCWLAMSSEASSRSTKQLPAFRRWGSFCGFLLLATATCGEQEQLNTPSFPDGGLLRVAEPLTRDQLMDFEGMFDLSAGTDRFGPDVAVRSSPGTVSILSGKDAGYGVLG